MATKIQNKKVVVVESTENALKHLRRDIHLNNVSQRVDIAAGVASNKSGTAAINNVEGKEECSSQAETVHSSISTRQYAIQTVNSIREHDP